MCLILMSADSANVKCICTTCTQKLTSDFMPNGEGLNEGCPLSFFRGNASKIKLWTTNAHGHGIGAPGTEIVTVNKLYFL